MALPRYNAGTEFLFSRRRRRYPNRASRFPSRSGRSERRSRDRRRRRRGHGRSAAPAAARTVGTGAGSMVRARKATWAKDAFFARCLVWRRKEAPATPPASRAAELKPDWFALDRPECRPSTQKRTLAPRCFLMLSHFFAALVLSISSTRFLTPETNLRR